MRSITAATICFALFAWVAASPVPSPVTPEDTSEVDNFDSRVSLTLEEMSALHSSTHRPHAPPIVKRSLMVESGPPPADNSDAVVSKAAAVALLRLDAAGPLSPQPPPQPHSSSSRRRRQLDADADNSLSAVPVFSRVSLTLEEMLALHSSTHRPHAPHVVKRSLMVEAGPPPADNSDAVVSKAAAVALLRLEEAGPLSPQPPPQPHSSTSRRRRQLEVADDSLSSEPVPSESDEDIVTCYE